MSTLKTYNVDSGDVTNLTVKTNGKAALTVDGSTQNVGISTNSPAYALHVAKASAAGAIWTTSQNTDATAGSQAGFLAVASGTNNYSTLSQVVGGSSAYVNSGAGSLSISNVQAQPLLFLTSATEKMRITSNGGVSFGSSGTAYGTAGQVLTSNGDTAPTWGSALVSGTAQASTSGTSIDFTGIPSWVKRITVMFSGVSTSGTSPVIVQLGNSSGPITTGYLSTAASTGATNGFITSGTAAADVRSGLMTIVNAGTNLWVAAGSNKTSTTNATSNGGNVTTNGTIDRVRITTVNGTDTFDAGSVNILYE